MKRRRFLKSATAACVAPAVVPSLLHGTVTETDENSPLLIRKIPSSGEPIPVVGLGTWQTFDVSANKESRQRLSQVLQTLVQAGGSVIDSSPMYGRSEAVVGELATAAGVADKLFYATKVWARGENAGINEMERSMRRMKAEPMDLMQVHNLVDADTHLQTLAKWKAQNRIRYMGITHYHQGGYPDMVRYMSEYPLDFIQINYSMMSTEVAQEVLPLAMKNKIAVLINRPYAGGQLFDRVKDNELPAWAAEFDCASWGQFFLKYILANEAVTCVIPGTSKVQHMQDNLAAGRGRLPTPEQRQKMMSYLGLS